MNTEDENGGSDCGEGCMGFEPMPGDPWSDYGICQQPGSPNHGFPVRRGQPCLRYFPRNATAGEPLLKPNGDSATNESR